MSKVFFDVGVSLDGYIAGPNRAPNNPLGDHGTDIHQWLYKTATFRRSLGLTDGDTSADDELVRAVLERAGAFVMGRHMFEEGEVAWPDPPPFHAPVFVLAHSARAPWARQGGTTFYFVTRGMASALEQAKEASGGKDVRISGGAATIRQFIATGLVDDFTLHIAPVLLGAGVRLFDQLEHGDLEAEVVGTTSSPFVTHIRYAVTRRGRRAG